MGPKSTVTPTQTSYKLTLAHNVHINIEYFEMRDFNGEHKDYFFLKRDLRSQNDDRIGNCATDKVPPFISYKTSISF